MLRSCCLAAIVFILTATVTPAQNLVINGDFEAGVKPWVFFPGQLGEVEVEGGVLKVKIFQGASNTQLYQTPLTLEDGFEYELSFKAWNEQRAVKILEPEQLGGRRPDNKRTNKTHLAPEGSLLVAVAQHGAPYENYGLRKLAILRSSPQQFVFRFIATGDNDDARLRFSFSAEFGEYLYFLDDVVLRKIACGNGTLDLDEECDDGNLEPGDGCDATCTTEFRISYATIDPETQALLLAGRGICTLGGPAQADPEVFLGDRSGGFVPVSVTANGPTFIVADVSNVDFDYQATHKLIVNCPAASQEIDVALGTSAQTLIAAVMCTNDMVCSLTAECPVGGIVSGTWSFDGNLGDIAGGVITGYTDTSYSVTLQGPAGFAGSTLEAQIRCAP